MAGERKARERAAAPTSAIHYLGTVDHETVPGLLAACDVGVSLVDDPHTLKVLEYGAAGLPVVQLAGRAEARFGDRLTYTSTEPAEIARAITAAATQDGTTLQAYVEQFDWAVIADTYAETIQAETGET
jgi:glycosyltransferase involved in cell wall biosynthesis